MRGIYTYQITLVARFLKNAGAFPKYDTFMEEFGNIAPFLIKAKDAQDERCAAMAEDFKDTDYHMGDRLRHALGRGLRLRHVHPRGDAVDQDQVHPRRPSSSTAPSSCARRARASSCSTARTTPVSLWTALDNFTHMLADEKGVNVRVNKFDTAEVELPFSDPEFRKIVSPMVTYTITERLSCPSRARP